MSYCRWSTDDYQCDVYAYENMDGNVHISVAAMRHDLESSVLPRPAPVNITDGVEEFVLRQSEFMQFLETCLVRPIGLPCDGDRYIFTDKAEAADKLQELKDMGYNVPENAINALKEEAAHEQ